MTGVLVVEDQQALASALEVAIGVQPGLECVGTASTVEAALARVAGRAPDVVLMDVELPGTDGIEGTRRIKAAHPEVKVLILTALATPRRLADATAAGADGFLAKDTPLPAILAAIRYPPGPTMVVQAAALRLLVAELPSSGVPAQAWFEPGDATGSGQGAAGAGQRSRELAQRGQELARRASELARQTARLAEHSGHLASPASLPGGPLTAREREVLALMGEGMDPRAISESLVVSLHTARGYVKNILMKLGAHSQLEAVVLATRSGLLPAEAPAGHGAVSSTAVPPTAVRPSAVPPSAVPPTAVPPAAVPPTAASEPTEPPEPQRGRSPVSEE
ncbi:MAG: response regulator [Streptosporangiaceae bacterium]